MKILKSEVTDNKIAKATSALNDSAASISQVVTGINNILMDTKLQGEAYQKIKSSMGEYVPLFEQSKQIASDLSSSLTSSTTSMASFMEDYGEIDDSKKEETQSELNQLSNNIYNTSQQIKGLEDGQEKSQLEQTVAGYQYRYNNLAKLLSKINDLSSQDASQYSKLAPAVEKLSSLKAGIDNLDEIVVKE